LLVRFGDPSLHGQCECPGCVMPGLQVAYRGFSAVPGTLHRGAETFSQGRELLSFDMECFAPLAKLN